MALEVPDAFLTRKPQPHPRHPSEASPDGIFRLPPQHIPVLRDVARGAEESDAGLCCTYLIDTMGGEGADFDEHALHAIERFAEHAMNVSVLEHHFGAVVSNWRARILRSRRAIACLRHHDDQRSANVIMVAYGYPDPLARQYPELAAWAAVGNLARYTDHVEDHRQELVKAEAMTERRTFNAPTKDPGRGWRGVDRTKDEIDRTAGDDRIQTGSEKARAAIAVGLDATQGNRGVVDLVRYRQRLRFADQAITSADALRAGLAPFDEPLADQAPDESRAAFEARKATRKERESAHRDRKATFLSHVHGQAVRMLSAAERAYHAAWIAVGR